MGPAAAPIMAAATVIGTAYSIYQGRQAQKSQEEAAEAQKQQATVEQNMANLKAEKQKQQQIRTARTERAEVLNLGATRGVQGSSGVAGGMSSIQSQAGANLGYMNQQQGMSNSASLWGMRSADAQSRANKYQSSSQMWGQVGSAAGQLGGYSALQSYGKKLGGGS